MHTLRFYILIFLLNSCRCEKRSSVASSFLSKFGSFKKVSKEESNAAEDLDSFDDDDDDYEDEDEALQWYQVPLQILKSEKAKMAFKFVTTTGLIGAYGYVGMRGLRYLKNFIAKRNYFKTTNAIESSESDDYSDDFSLPIQNLLNNVLIKDTNGSIITAGQDSMSGQYICLVFDCDNAITSSDDFKARLDYFTLMSNLTSAAVNMSTVYIPGKSNLNIVEKDVISAKHWKFFSSSKEGLRISKALRLKFGVKSEELRVVILNSNYEVTCENALDQLRISPKGMPWPPRNLSEILGNNLLAGNGGDLKQYDFKGKKIALYFSASWCKPCQTFLPILTRAYNNINNNEMDELSDVDTNNNEDDVLNKKKSLISMVDANTELVLVSLDKDETAFDTYRATMPWPAVPFRDIRRAELQNGLRVKAIPALLIFDENGQLLTTTGVTDLIVDKDLKNFPWLSNVKDLSDNAAIERLERGPALVAFIEGCSDNTKESIRKIMNDVASTFKNPFQSPKSIRHELNFCTLSTKGKLSEALRSLCMLNNVDENPKFAILDLSIGQFLPCTIPITNLNDEDSNNNEEVDITNSLQNFIKSYTSYEVILKDLDKSAVAQQQESESENTLASNE